MIFYIFLCLKYFRKENLTLKFMEKAEQCLLKHVDFNSQSIPDNLDSPLPIISQLYHSEKRETD